MESTARFFLCGRCRAQVLICRRCDRGQIYCDGGCAQAARCASMQAAGQHYQQSRRGRFKHAERSRRYRLRRRNVTHQGSMPSAGDDLLVANPVETPPAPIPRLAPPAHCHFCGPRCSEFVRTGFLTSRRVAPIVLPERGGAHGHFP